MSKRIWRDLLCTECEQIEGWTNGIMKMSKDYVMFYWCKYCQKPTVRQFVGEFYARDGKMQRVEQVFDFVESD